MSSFTTPLHLEYGLRGNEPIYVLLEPFEYYTELVWLTENNGNIFRESEEVEYLEFFRLSFKPYTITVPEGFVTNFASIPKIFHSILTPAGVHGKAAVVHDYLYGSLKKDFEESLMQAHSWVDVLIAKDFMEQSRELSDNVFKEAMDVLNVKRWKRDVMYTMVRMFGFSSILTGGNYE